MRINCGTTASGTWTNKDTGCKPFVRGYTYRVALVNWFSNSQCTALTSTDRVTIVSTPLGICNTVPATPGFSNNLAGYKVSTSTIYIVQAPHRDLYRAHPLAMACTSNT